MTEDNIMDNEGVRFTDKDRLSRRIIAYQEELIMKLREECSELKKQLDACLIIISTRGIG